MEAGTKGSWPKALFPLVRPGFQSSTTGSRSAGGRGFRQTLELNLEPVLENRARDSRAAALFMGKISRWRMTLQILYFFLSVTMRDLQAVAG
jgi:hypothetical protein